MLLSPSTIMALRPRGTRLDITLEQAEGNPQAVLTTRDRGTFHLSSMLLMKNAEHIFHEAFQYYPEPVTINEKPVERATFPDLASVHIAHAPNMDRSDTIVRAHALEQRPPADRRLNTYAGGIMSDIYQKHRPPKAYWAKLPSDHDHWSPAATIFVTPVYTVTQEEMASYGVIAFDNADVINARADAQVERTMKHHNMPLSWMDEPFHYITGAPLFLEDTKQSAAPIYVHGTPVVYRNDTIAQDDMVSVSQALYHTNTGFVPVVTAKRPKSHQARHRLIEDFDFHITGAQGTPGHDSTVPAERIDMTFRLDGENADRSVPTSFRVQKTEHHGISITFVPNRVTRQDLEQAAIQAWWDHEAFRVNDERYEHMEEITAKVKDLMEPIAHLLA